MSSILDRKVIKDDKKSVIVLVIFVLVNIWFFSNPSKRIMEFSFLGNFVKYKYAQITHNTSADEYIYHRNNAIYLIKLNNKNRAKHAIMEMDKAISTVPDYISPEVIQGLYRDRAYIKLYTGDKKGALDDLLLSGELNINDNLKAAALLTEREIYGMAKKHCQNIIKENDSAVSGYICLSHVYEHAGRPMSAMKIYNYAIDKKRPNNPKLYVERALLKQRINDFKGYDEDIAIAKNLSPNVNINQSLMDETLKAENLTFTVQ